MLRIYVNGQAKEVEADTTVLQLLTELKLDATRVAVERNLEIVLRKTFAEAKLTSDDRLEIVTLVGGG